MNIRIDDDVPLPEPSKPDTWAKGAVSEVGDASGWSGPVTVVTTKFKEPVTVTADGWTSEPVVESVNVTRYEGRKAIPVEQPERYPAETTYNSKGVPTVDCFLVGGPLNGKNGPIVGTAQVVELNIYAADGSVSSVELYELGSRGDLGGRYWKGTKQ